MTAHPLFTIGHSNREADELLALLRDHRVDAVADVRSQPASRRWPQFSAGPLKAELKKAGIEYVFLGDQLGARRSEADCYVAGQARYDLIAQADAFQQGLTRLRRGLATRRIALLCAEKDPLTCHRMILVCRHLRDDCEIQHILDGATVETQAEAERRLIIEWGLPTAPDLFRTMDEIVAEAYDRQAAKIAYRATDGSAANDSATNESTVNGSLASGSPTADREELDDAGAQP